MQGKVTAGHPVDVASGILFDTRPDILIPGRFDMPFERHHSTAILSRPAGCLGPLWSMTYEIELQLDAESALVTLADGAQIRFDGGSNALARGETVINFGAFAELRRDLGRIVIVAWDPDAHDSTRYVFSGVSTEGTARLSGIEDCTGQGVDIVRDSSGKVRKVRQRREHRALAFTYRADGRLASVDFVAANGSASPMLAFMYNDRGLLAEVAHSGGYSERYEYDLSNRLVREVNRTGGVFNFRYDTLGRCVLATGLGDFDRKTFRYLPSIGVTEMVDSTGAVTRYNWNGSGQVVREESPLANIAVTEFDEFGRFSAIVAPDGGRTEYAYDLAGNRSGISNPLGETTQFVYNERRQLVQFVDANAGIWRLSYDSVGNLRTSIDPLGNVWRCEVNEFGEVVRVIDPNGSTMSCSYDSLGSLIQNIDWEGNAVRYEYTDAGLISRRIDPSGAATTFDYDLLHQVTRIVRPDGETTYFTYDSGGNVTGIADSDGLIKSFRYLPCNRLSRYWIRGGEQYSFEWTTEPARLHSIANAMGQTWEFGYDDEGRLISEVDFSGRRTELSYGSTFHYTGIVQNDGSAIKVERDLLGRITRRQLPDGTSVEYAYDSFGNIVLARNSGDELRFNRDPLGRVTMESGSEHWIASAYDRNGCRVRRKGSDGAVLEIAYDRNCRPIAYSTGNGAGLLISRDPAGRERRISFANNYTVEREFDVAGRLTEQNLLRSSPDGRALSAVQRENLANTHRWAYDAEDRPIRFSDAQRGTVHWTYDASGQLVHSAGPSGVETFGYDALGTVRQQSNAPVEYVHDDLGRVVRKTRRLNDGLVLEWQFTWNGEGWLETCTTPAGERWHYAYDAFGRRTAKSSASTREEFVWDGDLLASRRLPEGEGSEHWVFDQEGFAPLYCATATEAHYFVNGIVGRPVERLDASAADIGSELGPAWGKQSDQQSDRTLLELGFEGQIRDPESGLFYNRFRYYDPDTGTYLSPDPIGAAGDLNTYRYAPSPTCWVDAFGLDRVTEPVGNRDYHFDRDSQGRTVRAEGPLVNPNRLVNEDRSTSAQKRVAGGTGDHAGHLIGNQFGGPGGDANLVRMCPTLNLGKWKKMENQLVKLTKNNSVRVVVTVHYNGNSTKPSKFTVEAIVTDRKGRETRRRWRHKNC